MERYFIGDIAKKFGLNPKTIRYYESIGVLPRATRTESGYRVFSLEIVERIEFILKAKTLGLTLEEIKEIISLYEKGEAPCECTRDFFKNKILEIDDKIAALTALKEKLARLVKLKKTGRTSGVICPIIAEPEKGT